MKIALFRSRFKPYAGEEQEIPTVVNLRDGECVTVKLFEKYHPRPCKQDAPFGVVGKEVCCENCN